MFSRKQKRKISLSLSLSLSRICCQCVCFNWINSVPFAWSTLSHTHTHTHTPLRAIFPFLSPKQQQRKNYPEKFPTGKKYYPRLGWLPTKTILLQALLPYFLSLSPVVSRKQNLKNVHEFILSSSLCETKVGGIVFVQKNAFFSFKWNTGIVHEKKFVQDFFVSVFWFVRTNVSRSQSPVAFVVWGRANFVFCNCENGNEFVRTFCPPSLWTPNVPFLFDYDNWRVLFVFSLYFHCEQNSKLFLNLNSRGSWNAEKRTSVYLLSFVFVCC